MKLFKPYVNLTKSNSTGEYTLNSVVSLPKGYALKSLKQNEVKRDGKVFWGVTASVQTNGAAGTEIAEFAIPLEQGPSDQITTVSMIVVDSSVMANPENENSTDVDYDDAEGVTP